MDQRAPQRGVSVADYPEAEASAAVKHEYFDGEVVAMAGGTEDHSLVIGNVIREAGNALKGKPCRVYDSNLKVRITEINRFYYPDAFIVCGESEYPPEDKNHTSVTNPRVIFATPRDSSCRNDPRHKFSHYVLLPSLREYVLISQDELNVQVFLRQDDATWKLTFYRGLDAVARLESIEIDLPLAEVYAGVKFGSEA